VVLDSAGMAVPELARSAIDDNGMLAAGALWRAVAAPAQWPDLLRLTVAHRGAGRSLRRLWAAVHLSLVNPTD
jgi:hypothetical protein